MSANSALGTKSNPCSEKLQLRMRIADDLFRRELATCRTVQMMSLTISFCYKLLSYVWFSEPSFIRLVQTMKTVIANKKEINRIEGAVEVFGGRKHKRTTRGE
ncbi:hypothetical protein CDAR_262171 [Caerostris darwini]|uniref:Uncharacterized protein n=1 Tax=Caerostris darwini TaxID=1538125 RepID=A0AAV4P4R1_9ARAC|nr:hypothetical protein CDAR_262171 [Caerostris darwini]